MPMSIKHGGVWKEAEVHVKHLGSWKRAEVWVKQGGVWKQAASVAPAVSFNPPGGSLYGYAAQPGTASVYVECSVAAVWTFTQSTGLGSASISTGQSSPTATFYLQADGFGKTDTFFVDATANGVTQSWTIQLDTDQLS